MTDQIQVRESPARYLMMTGLRDFLKVVGTAFATKGVYDGSVGEVSLGLAMFAAPIVWSQIVTVLNHKKLVALADAAPNGEVVK